MPHCRKRWVRWRQQAFFLLVRCCCSLEKRFSRLSYSWSAQDVWWWSFSLVSAENFSFFLGFLPTIFPVRTLITGSQEDAASFHVHKQAVLAILVINQDEIPNSLCICAFRKLWVSDLGRLRIFKPVFRDIICSRENNSGARRIDRFSITIPILQVASVIVILPPLAIQVNEIAREVKIGRAS